MAQSHHICAQTSPTSRHAPEATWVDSAPDHFKSKSVLDLSTTRVLDRIDDYESPTPSDVGDLNVASARAWSRSVDDLSSFASPGPAPSASNPVLSTSQNASTPAIVPPSRSQRDNHRKGSPSPGRAAAAVPFPSRATTVPKIAPPITTAPPPLGSPHSPSMTHSPSSPTFTFRVTDAPPAVDPPPNAHARSKSHGAHHPSNIIKPPTFIPPSPSKSRNQEPLAHKRKGSVEKDVGKSHGGAFSGLASFPFHFGGGSSSSYKSQNTMGTPPSDAPDMRGSPRAERQTSAGGTPSISVEAEPEPSSSTVRNSQIIHCTGFVNRFAKPSKFNGQGLSSDKGWKTYKAQLIGTKLYFYKPPADRAAEIKDLFLTGPTPIEVMTKEPEAIAESDAAQQGNSRGRARDDGRRKRVYWGRARHAELVVSDAGEVVSGSADALIHEMVFATAFKLHPAAAEAETEPTEASQSAAASEESAGVFDETKWKEFVTAMLLFLPSLVEKSKFEAEVLRDLSSFERGASEEEKAANASRLQWLLAEYLRLHGTAADDKEWRALMIRPKTPETLEISTSESSTSVPTITLSPSPAVPQSPTFTNPPSPGRAGGRPPVERSASNDSFVRSKFAALLAEEGLSRDTLSRYDHRRMGDSLAVFQRSLSFGESILASEFLTAGTPTDLVSAFSGSDDRPNWLTRLVVDMILGQVGKAEMRGDDGPDGSGSRTSSSTYIRATTVGRWIKVGDRCLTNGDECSWRAIAAALCCIAVVRLEKVWKRVEEQDRQTVEDWVKGERKREGEGISVWFGDLRRAMADAVEGARVTGQADRFRIAPLVGATKQLRDSLRRWEVCAAMRRSQKQHSSETSALVEFWGRCRADPSPRLASINQMLPLSFAIESRQRGQYQPYFWKPQPAHSATQSILPLLFPEPLPTISLIDRNALIRTKKETLLGPVPGAEVNEAQVQKLTNPNPRSSKSRTPSRQRNIAEVDLDETLIPCFGGELILKLPRDDGKSRPTSFVDSLFPNASQPDGAKAPTRGNSIRLNTGSRLERKGSQMRLSRRSSLPSISQRNSLLIPDAPVVESSMRVTVKSGTLDRLVDVLVSGLDGVGVSHADDNGEMPLRDGKSKSFKVDRAEFARVWWTGFRSFVTPLVLFELLRKRFVGGHTNADPLLKRDASPSDNSTESPATTQLRLDVLSTLSYWLTVGGGAQDILDDLELYQSAQAFLNSDLPGCSHDVLTVRKSLLETFVSLTSLPVRDVTPPKESNGVEGQTHRFGSQPPPLDDITPDDLVSNLDAIAQSVFRGVTEASMFELADLLETQTADRTGWFTMRDGSSHDDTVVIQDLYLHLQNVETSALIASGSQHEHLYRLLSPSLRTVIRAHNSLRDWLIFKLTNPAIPYSTRVKRMELIIKAVEACRSRSRDSDSSSEDFDMDQPVVRSFVEAAVVSSILSPESRAYARAWHDVAGNRNTSVEDLVSLVSVSHHTTTGKGPSLTVDPAWIMERMLEIITLPDVIEREESQSLINLEKRRFLHNLVVNTAGLGTRGASEAERQDMERLSNMAREAHQGAYDYRSVREAAQREMSHLSFNHGKRLVRPFYQLVGLQHEKTKRDRYLRDKLMKEKRSEQLRSDKRASLLNKAMQPNRNGSVSQKHVRQKRSASGMYSLFRPLSVAFGATMERAGSWEGPRRSAAELDFPALKPKADLTMNLVGAGVRSFINDQRPFTIQLDLEDGGRFLLQTVSGTECNKWLQGIKKVAETSALRRLTYLGRNAIPAYNEPGDLNAGPKDPNGIFGKDILTILQRESPTGEYVPGAIPRVVEMCLAEINKRGLQEPGLHRVAGSKSLCNQLRAEFNSGRTPDLTIDGNYPDIHVVGDCLRQWFRELPESVFTNHLYASFLEATKIPDYDERKNQLRALIWQLPQPNFDILRRLLEHLDMVVDNEEYNHMTPDSLAICFNVTLCKPPTLASFDNMQHTLSLVKHCILHYGYLFSELEPEFEENQEFDEVLLEEDEPEEEGEDAKSSSGPESPSAQDGSPPDQRGLLGSSFEANMTQTSFFTAPEPSPSPHSPTFNVPTAL
ncbi:rho GTPase-activating protein [Tulasnella sp. 425]|nr:rho GTPase-activating protein [Tulasnella sp. 425]